VDLASAYTCKCKRRNLEAQSSDALPTAWTRESETSKSNIRLERARVKAGKVHLLVGRLGPIRQRLPERRNDGRDRSPWDMGHVVPPGGTQRRSPLPCGTGTHSREPFLRMTAVLWLTYLMVELLLSWTSFSSAEARLYLGERKRGMMVVLAGDFRSSGWGLIEISKRREIGCD